jgi:hypothetical protein
MRSTGGRCCSCSAVALLAGLVPVCVVTGFAAGGGLRMMAALEYSAAPVNRPETWTKTYELAKEGQGGFKKKLSLLGSTGSIGTQTLDICAEKPELFEVTALAAGSNIDLLAKQIAQFKPKVCGFAKDTTFASVLAAKACMQLLISPCLLPTLRTTDGLCRK